MIRREDISRCSQVHTRRDLQILVDRDRRLPKAIIHRTFACQSGGFVQVHASGIDLPVVDDVAGHTIVAVDHAIIIKCAAWNRNAGCRDFAIVVHNGAVCDIEIRRVKQFNKGRDRQIRINREALVIVGAGDNLVIRFAFA